MGGGGGGGGEGFQYMHSLAHCFLRFYTTQRLTCMHTRYCLDNEKLSYLCKVHEQLKFAFCMNNEKLSYLDTNNLQGITRGFILELCKCKFIGKVLTNLMDLLTRNWGGPYGIGIWLEGAARGIYGLAEPGKPGNAIPPPANRR